MGESHAACRRETLAGKIRDRKRNWPQRSPKAVMSALHYGEQSVSVGIEEVKPTDWAELVYKPDILAKRATIYKEPGYEP
jgi:4-oxalocrotonate tautomerase